MTIQVNFDKNALKGGEFLIKNTNYIDVFIPEMLNDEETEMIKGMVRDFLNDVIFPMTDRIEKQEPGLAQQLLQQAGELGIIGADFPEEYGGMNLGTNTETVILDIIGPAGSFNTTMAAHTGIGCLPILYFGTEEQKKKYLPELIAGTKVAAYCLTEPSAGSDALSGKTVAMPDGDDYLIDGQKMWISNAGFADVFIVFAQVDGDKFTGFIVERETPGITFGAEEKKLGIKGSSTRQVYFEKVRVPKENILGEIGKGHQIAFNVLNVGRYKLCVLSIGGAKRVLKQSIGYAIERHQFGKSISSFGAIQYKLAEMAIRNFAAESAMYRVSDMLEQLITNLKDNGLKFHEAKLQAAEEYAIECSILKVLGSEILDYCTDENIQIHGGMGFSEEGDVARAYRDARITRIYEGTNEINRLLIVDMLLKRAMKGRIDIVGPAWEVQKELASMPSFSSPTGDFAEEYKALADFKKLILMVAGGAAKQQMDGQLNMKHEQELIMNVSDMMIDLFMAESMLLRVHKLKSNELANTTEDVYTAALKTFYSDVNHRMVKNASDALVSFAEGDLLKTFLMGVRRFTKYPPYNVKNGRRIVAKACVDKADYCF